MSNHCPAIDGFYLRADGSFVCWNSPGELHPIVLLDADRLDGVDIVRDVLNGEAYRRMRRELCADRDPFEYCPTCGWGGSPTDDPRRHVDPESFVLRSIDTLQIEPSFLCNLDCPQCIPIEQRMRGRPPFSLDPRLFRRLIDDLVRHKIAVERIQYGGFGEPLMTPEFPAMARYAKERLGCHAACDTNGNFPFREELLDCGVDWYVLAFDGVEQRSYERYRRRGKLDRVLRFAADARDAKRCRGLEHPRIAWKTVLFEWNSSDEELRGACRLAAELEVDEVRFVSSTTPGGISSGSRTDRAREIRELLDELRASCPVPILYEDPDCFAGEPHRCHGFVEALVDRGEELHVAGWVLLDDGPPDRILVLSKTGTTAVAEPSRRADLPAAHPTIPRAELGGFLAMLPARDFADGGAYSFDVRLMRGEVERACFPVKVSRGWNLVEESPRPIRHGRAIRCREDTW